jgi:predicted nucleic acid-binding protein
VTVFFDSSVWCAAADARDRDNARAKELVSEADCLVTSDHVLLETWVLLRNRLGQHAAETFWGGLRRGVAGIEIVREADLELAWSIGESWQDQDFSFVDRTSFAVMQRLGLSRVASFDRDFAVYRYGRNRDRAFEVLR